MPPKYNTITASHQKGGVGKSTILWNMIIETAKRRPVKVVDLDMQKTISYSLHARKSLGLSLHNIELVSVENEKQLIDLIKSKKEEEIVFIDSGGFDSSLNRIAITISELLLTPVSSEFYELLGLREYEKILKNISNEIGTKIIATIVFNKINPNTKEIREMKEFVERSEYFYPLKSILRHRVDYKNSPAHGKSVVELAPKDKAAEEFQTFFKELLVS